MAGQLEAWPDERMGASELRLGSADRGSEASGHRVTPQGRGAFWRPRDVQSVSLLRTPLNRAWVKKFLRLFEDYWVEAGNI